MSSASKLHSNRPKCQELGWTYIPLAVETYGNCGKEAQDTISRASKGKQFGPCGHQDPVMVNGQSCCMRCHSCESVQPKYGLGASTTVGFAAAHKEELQSVNNGPKCKELGWECIPQAVETYGGWGEKACETFKRTCKRLAVGSASNEVAVRQELFGRLSLVLIAQTILAKSNWPSILGSE
eukprot:Em0019g865a